MPFFKTCLIGPNPSPMKVDRFVGPVVKVSTSRVVHPGFEFCLKQDFSRTSHTSYLKIDSPVAAVSGVCHCRVSAGTGQLRVSILWLGEVERLVCSFYLSVEACKVVFADPSLEYTSVLVGHSASNKQPRKVCAGCFSIPGVHAPRTWT